MDIEIKLGDKVIRKDGLVGKVVEVFDNGTTWDKCKVEQAKYDQLRKQLWYLKNRMVEDWYEKK